MENTKQNMVKTGECILSTEIRNTCELCGCALTTPEEDHKNTAVCEECMKGQLEEFESIRIKESMDWK